MAPLPGRRKWRMALAPLSNILSGLFARWLSKKSQTRLSVIAVPPVVRSLPPPPCTRGRYSGPSPCHGCHFVVVSWLWQRSPPPPPGGGGPPPPLNDVCLARPPSGSLSATQIRPPSDFCLPSGSVPAGARPLARPGRVEPKRRASPTRIAQAAPVRRVWKRFFSVVAPPPRRIIDWEWAARRDGGSGRAPRPRAGRLWRGVWRPRARRRPSARRLGPPAPWAAFGRKIFVATAVASLLVGKSRFWCPPTRPRARRRPPSRGVLHGRVHRPALPLRPTRAASGNSPAARPVARPLAPHVPRALRRRRLYRQPPALCLAVHCTRRARRSTRRRRAAHSACIHRRPGGGAHEGFTAAQRPRVRRPPRTRRRLNGPPLRHVVIGVCWRCLHRWPCAFLFVCR